MKQIISTVALLIFSVSATAAPTCPDGMRPVPVPVPRPKPKPPVTPPAEPAKPPVTPTKPPQYKAPEPPPKVEEPADPARLGIPVLDDALEGKASRHLLPYWHGYPWQKIERPLTWTKWLYDHLGTDGSKLIDVTPKDAVLFCPNYKNLDQESKRIFWMRMISVIVELESTYNSRKAYHSVRVQPGLFSIGLLMLSLPSSTQSRFGCSMIKSNDDLFDWRKNMTCGVRIMSYYYSEDKSITGRTSLSKTDSRWMGIARYWEPFRDQRLREEGGFEAVLKKVKQKRRSWLKDAERSKHPAYFDETYKKSGEKDMERIARLLNTMPFCLTGAADEFEEEPPVPVAPIPSPNDPAYLCVQK